MIGAVLGSLAGPVVGSLIGGYFGKKSDERNIRAQDQANAQNLDWQKQVAQNSLQWRVDDAKKAGLHPLAGIGATPYQAVPSSQAYERTAGRDMGNNLAQAFAKIDLGTQKQLRSLEIERAQLENELLKNNVRNTAVTGVKPSVAMEGQINSQNPLVNTNKSEITANNPEAKHVSAGVKPAFDLIQTSNKNEFRLITNSEVAEATEQNLLQQWMVNLDGIYVAKPDFADKMFRGMYNPKTQHIEFNPLTQKFTIKNNDDNFVSGIKRFFKNKASQFKMENKKDYLRKQ